MLSPAGSVAERQRIAGGRGGEVAGDIEREGLTLVGALVGDLVAVGPLSPTASWKLSLTAMPWASVAVTVIGLVP